MGFWSRLGRIGLAVAPYAAAPFTGGASLALAPILQKAAMAGVQSNQTRDILNQRQYEDEESARLARDKFALAAPGERMSQSVKASILGNLKPTSINWGGPGSGLKGETPTYSGGFSEALQNMDPDTRALLSRIIQDNLKSQTTGGSTGGGQDAYTKPSPEFGKTSTMDKIIGGGAFATSILGALGKGGASTKSKFNYGDFDYGDADFGNDEWMYH